MVICDPKRNELYFFIILSNKNSSTILSISSFKIMQPKIVYVLISSDNDLCLELAYISVFSVKYP